MSDEEIREILQRKDRWIVLTTIGPDGFPHSVPVGYFLIEDRVIMGCKSGTQKVANIEREPKVSLLWENGRGAPELIGILIRGRARIVKDDAQRLEFKAEACRQRGEVIPQSVGDGFYYIEVTPVKTISWRRPSGRRTSGQSASPSR